MGEWGVELHSLADLRTRLAVLANLAFNRPDVFAFPKILLEVPEITAIASPSPNSLLPYARVTAALYAASYTTIFLAALTADVDGWVGFAAVSLTAAQIRFQLHLVWAATQLV